MLHFIIIFLNETEVLKIILKYTIVVYYKSKLDFDLINSLKHHLEIEILTKNNILYFIRLCRYAIVYGGF